MSTPIDRVDSPRTRSYFIRAVSVVLKFQDVKNNMFDRLINDHPTLSTQAVTNIA